MADIGFGVVGVVSLALQITQTVVQFGLDWKDAPHNVRTFIAELRALQTTLLKMNDHVLENTEFRTAFEGRSSILLSQLGPAAPPISETKDMLQQCEEALQNLLAELKKRLNGHRVGWERMKGAFLSKKTRQSVTDLSRQCQSLNSLATIDMAALGATTHNEVRATRTDIKEVRKEQENARQEQLQAQKYQVNQDEIRKRQEILSWLTPIDYSDQHNDIVSKRQEGMGQWLLDSDQFQTWVDQPSQTLFCPGIPGAGKTFCTSMVVDELYRKFKTDVGITYIYCDFRRQHEQKITDLLSSLLKQFLQETHSIPQETQQLYEQHQRQKSRPTLREISQALQTVTAQYSRTFIVVDALDEYQTLNQDWRQFLSEIFSLQEKIFTNIFATSRFVPEIEKEFNKKDSQIEIRASEEDLHIFLGNHIRKLLPLVSQKPNLAAEIKTAIVHAADGMFLLARLHLDSLRGKSTIKGIKKALQTLPSGTKAYDQAYYEAMTRIQGQLPESRTLAERVISWITCAKREITPLELQHALAVEIGESDFDIENLTEIDQIVSVCVGLVTIDKMSNTIRLVHYTTQEFFERTLEDWFPEAKKDIAQTLMSYLSLAHFASGFCQSDEDFESRLYAFPLFDYAARNWGYHFLKSEGCDPNLEFLKSSTRVAACSQALMSSADSRYIGYSQVIPTNMKGVHLAAWFNLPKLIVKLAEDGYNPECKDSYDRTPLSYAAENGHEEAVKLLMARDDVKVDSKDRYDRTPLSWAAKNGYKTVVELLMMRDNVNADSKNKDGQTPLSLAAEYGHVAVVKLLMALDDIVKVDSKDQYGRTPLSWAAGNGHETAVKLLIARDAVDINSDDGFGRTPLWLAAEHGHEAVVKLLIARDDVDVDLKDEDGQTPLWLAAKNGHEAVVKLLIARDDIIEVDPKDRWGRTPLLRAAQNGREAVVKLLIARDDVEVNSKDKDGQTPLCLAAQNGHEAVVKLLIARDDVEVNSKDEDGQTPLRLAANNGHEAVVKLLIARDDVEVNSKDEDGQTPLWLAANNGHEAVVKLLIARDDVEVDLKDKDGQTPLLRAAQNGHEAVVKLLVARDYIINVDSRYGQMPPSWTARNRYETMVKLLMAREDVDIDLEDNDSQTLLLWAARNGCETAVKSLLARDDVQVNFKDKDGWTPLWLAVRHGHETVVRLLVARDDVDVNYKNQDGRTPLLWAVENRHETITWLLMARDDVEVDFKNESQLLLLWAVSFRLKWVVKLLTVPDDVDFNSKDEDSGNLLRWAAMDGPEAVVKLLVARDDVNVNSKNDENGFCPLSYAAVLGRDTVVKLLMTRGEVDINSKDQGGRTPLSWAAECGHEAVVKLLMARDEVDVDFKDHSGRTPLSLAAQNGHEPVVKLLMARNVVDVNSKDQDGYTPLWETDLER